MRILAVGDDRKLLSFLVRALREDAYAVDTVLGAERALEIARGIPYDLILVDIRLRGSSGIQVCAELRKHRVKTPILLLSGDSLVEERVEGLNAGADDCLPKPFAVSELRARVCALIRRSKDRTEVNSRIADLEIDRHRRCINRGGVTIPLTTKEFALVELLMLHSPETVTRSEIIEHVWDCQYDSDTNLVDVYIYRLRQKINDMGAARLIHAIRGVGYKLECARPS
jgi:two-component system, OmpR family, copper resistance phosphate regulon response regulator CusR